MTKVTCPVCKSSVERSSVMGEMLPPELDEHGLPMAGSVIEGYGLPIVGAGWEVTIDGRKIKDCVAFDRKARVAWAYVRDLRGNYTVTNGELHAERIEGEVTVQQWKLGK